MPRRPTARSTPAFRTSSIRSDGPRARLEATSGGASKTLMNPRLLLSPPAARALPLRIAVADAIPDCAPGLGEWAPRSLTQSMKAARLRLLLFAECASWAFGLVGLVWWGTFQVGVATSTGLAVERFCGLRRVVLEAGRPGQSLWSPERARAWRKALTGPAPAPVSVVRIPTVLC